MPNSLVSAATTTYCEHKKRPVQFGASIQTRSFSSSRDVESDCPVCQRYSQGPCGALFQKWLACTDAHPETHLQKCLHLAEPLAKCLDQHDEHYNNPSLLYENQDEELQNAWLEVIAQVESQYTPLDLDAKHVVEMEFRPRDGTGMAAFLLNLNDDKHPIILAYVKDQSGTLLAAGAQEDLWEYTNEQQEPLGVLRIQTQNDTRTITAFCLYHDETTDNDVLYSYTQRLPPKM